MRIRYQIYICGIRNGLSTNDCPEYLFLYAFWNPAPKSPLGKFCHGSYFTGSDRNARKSTKNTKPVWV